MRVLGIDYGIKRIGIGIGNTISKVAVPFEVVGDIEEIKKIVQDENIELAIVGMPFRADNSISEVGEKVEKFVKEVVKFVPVEIQDERYTTSQIENIMKGYGSAKRGIDKDAAAAALILQSYFDRL